MRRIWFFSLVALCCMWSSCSINKMAINAVSDALTGPGSNDVFTGDDDPKLVGDALPFAIKMYESLLSSNPEHEGLILTTGSLFVMYANAFVQGPAQLLPSDRYMERDAELVRAKRLYLRGTAILERGLEKKFPGFAKAYNDGNLDAILAKAEKNDVSLLYWTVAGTLSAFSLDPLDLELGRKIPALTAIIARAYELDPDFNNGAIDEFYILFYGSLPSGLGGNPALANLHYEKAIERAKGMSAGVHVSYAQAVAVPAQDYARFKEELNKALAVDVNAQKETRLVNIIAQRRARYLLDHAPDYFIDLGEDEALFFENIDFGEFEEDYPEYSED